MAVPSLWSAPNSYKQDSFWLSGIMGDTQTHRQQGDLKSLLLFFQNKESRLKI
jgi:hypothetical protein